MARRHATRFIRPVPRTKMWIGSGVGVTMLTASTKHLVSTLSAGALLLRPFTILRTHMQLLFESDQSTVGELPFGAYAKIIVTDTAAAIGVTAVPDPSLISGDPEAGWFISQPLICRTFGIVTAGFDGNSGHQYTIDSKSMRKVGPDDNIVGMATLDSAVGANLTTIGRMLIQLH